VALSILGEIVAERRSTSGRPVQEPSGPEEASQRPGTAIDPVCGMTVATLETSLHLDHEGARYWFCGSGCLRAFAADPAGYLAP
jgi:xanthine dehydrogenase accessory factor